MPVRRQGVATSANPELAGLVDEHAVGGHRPPTVFRAVAPAAPYPAVQTAVRGQVSLVVDVEGVVVAAQGVAPEVVAAPELDHGRVRRPALGSHHHVTVAVPAPHPGKGPILLEARFPGVGRLVVEQDVELRSVPLETLRLMSHPAQIGVAVRVLVSPGDQHVVVVAHKPFRLVVLPPGGRPGEGLAGQPVC